ncbi:MAG: nitroreductase family protein, partial [Clostridia bacterium]|nr:nitroreductase family protein [Clostridia bacterium]
RFAFEELFFDGSWEKALTEKEAGKLADVLQAVRWAPSAVNKQPWRVVVCGDKAHFYEKRSKGYVAENGWDLQKIDLGIALCHFELAAKESGMDAVLKIGDPGFPIGEDMAYIATYVIHEAGGAGQEE